jgi:hypothetical protein
MTPVSVKIATFITVLVVSILLGMLLLWVPDVAIEAWSVLGPIHVIFVLV